VITADDGVPLPIPGRRCGFGELCRAQARGDHSHQGDVLLQIDRARVEHPVDEGAEQEAEQRPRDRLVLDAQLLGQRFGVMTFIEQLVPLYTERFRSYGHTERCAGVAWTGFGFRDVLAGYSGSTVPMVNYGTFTPLNYNYLNVNANQTDQNFDFTRLECPIPGPLATIPLPGGNTASRNVIDPVNNRLWVISENDPNVYIIDVQSASIVSTQTYSVGNGYPCIEYDPVNRQMVLMDYANGDIIFADAASYAELGRIPAEVRWTSFHMLAVDKTTGTVYACDYRNSAGRVYVIDGATRAETGRFSLTPNGIFAESIAFCSNIGKLAIAAAGFSSRIYYFDPSGTFTPSSIISTTSFNYEDYYVEKTGHLLISSDGHTGASIVDVVHDTVIGSITATRISDATEDTCSNLLFVSDGNNTIYELDLANSYNALQFFVTNPSGLAHSRKTNLVYYENWNVSNQVETLKAYHPGPPSMTARIVDYPTFFATVPLPGGVGPASGDPAWNGVWDYRINAGNLGSDMDVFYTLDKSYKGVAISANQGSNTYPTGNWYQTGNFTQLYFDGYTWQCWITADDGNTIWSGQNTVAGVDFAGTYAVDGWSPSPTPTEIIVTP
jgi:DNA-binding beta-propeller fold protein YncE